MRSIAVLGPGGVGGFVAGALARAGEPVTLVARQPTADVISRDGLRVRSVLLVDLASDEPGARPAMEALAAALGRSGIPTRIGATEAQVLWGKLVRLNALACTTAAADRPLGFIRSDPEWRAALEACVSEGAAAAAAEGARIEPTTVLDE